MAEDPNIARAKGLALNMLRHIAVIRSRSYKRVFMRDGRIDRDAEIVLADLRELCFANSTTFSADPNVASRRQGRREVWLRIAQHLNLDEERVQKLVELEDGI